MVTREPSYRGGKEAAAMSTSGAVTLGEIGGRLRMLEVVCSRCERRGRLDVAKLIERHGADTRLPDLRVILAGRRLPAHRRCIDP